MNPPRINRTQSDHHLPVPPSYEAGAASLSVLSGQERDEYGAFWAKAIEVTRSRQNPSVAAIQRHCRLGYVRANRIVEKMISLGWIRIVSRSSQEMLPTYEKTGDFPQ